MMILKTLAQFRLGSLPVAGLSIIGTATSRTPCPGRGALPLKAWQKIGQRTARISNASARRIGSWLLRGQ
jgi:hypothetical protein